MKFAEFSIGDTYTTKAVVMLSDEKRGIIKLGARITNQEGKEVLTLQSNVLIEV